MRQYFLLIFLFFTSFLYAQQDPLITHYNFMKTTFNPAYAGLEGEVCVNLLSHQQWRKFENAPLTTILSVDAPFNLLNQKWGGGVVFVDDRYGFVHDFKARFNLSFQKDLGLGKISFGVSPGIFNKKFDPSWKFPDQNEPILEANSNATIFDLGVGAFYIWNELFVGLSSSHLLRPNFYFVSETEGGTNSSIFLVNHFYFIGGYNIKVANSAIDLTPSIFVKSIGNDMQFDINIFALYNKKFWASVTYRNKAALAFMVGTSYFNNLKLGLSYDLSLTYLNRVSSGTFEAYVGYCFSFLNGGNPMKYRNVKTL
ncbi:MAG: PorP/SprF family type IX secretion system membrane protein [Bacteroidales bacterium]|nr:PorP/SprF family type IX secretion system membrane protein [Bacteroidales bacterium]